MLPNCPMSNRCEKSLKPHLSTFSNAADLTPLLRNWTNCYWKMHRKYNFFIQMPVSLKLCSSSGWYSLLISTKSSGTKVIKQTTIKSPKTTIPLIIKPVEAAWSMALEFWHQTDQFWNNRIQVGITLLTSALSYPIVFNWFVIFNSFNAIRHISTD